MNDTETRDSALITARVIIFLLLCAAAAVAPFIESGKPARIQPAGFSIKP